MKRQVWGPFCAAFGDYKGVREARQQPRSRSAQAVGSVQVRILLVLPGHHGASRSSSNLFLRLKIIAHIYTNINIFKPASENHLPVGVQGSLQVNWQITKANATAWNFPPQTGNCDLR